MISDDKMQHIVHLMLDGIEKAKLVTYSNKELAVREARKVALQHMAMLSKVAETARHRIESQKNPPPEHSSQWDTLYQKYYEEEWKKKGG